jgi:hypothetical protein
MTATKTQLTGGLWQDSEGNVLNDGYLKMVLNQDNSVSGAASICAGVEITIQLNSSGSVSTTTPQYVWATDVMVTPNAYYRVTAYSAAGQPVWGPNNQQVTSGGIGGGTFDCGTWVPNSVFSWTPPVQSILFENNGTKNSSQTILNLESSDSSITITDEGGGTINLQATGTSVAAGTNITQLPPPANGTSNAAFPGTVVSPVNSSGATNTLMQYIPGNSLLCTPTHFKITIGTYSSSTTVTAVIVKCTAGTGSVLSSTPITFGGVSSPTLSPAGLYQSDSIAFTFSSQYDYYILLNTSTGLILITASGTGQIGNAGGVYVGSANMIGQSTLVFTGGTLEPGKAITFSLQSA